jgi:hypothetical protein
MKKMPWTKFVWKDWAGDPALRCCSMAAQGLWMRLLAIAHEGDPPGHVTINGLPATEKQIAAIAGFPIKQVKPWLSELEREGVFSLTEEGVIYSRRMVRDHADLLAAVGNGKKGGNPMLNQARRTVSEGWGG